MNDRMAALQHVTPPGSSSKPADPHQETRLDVYMAATNFLFPSLFIIIILKNKTEIGGQERVISTFAVFPYFYKRGGDRNYKEFVAFGCCFTHTDDKDNFCICYCLLNDSELI